MGLTRSPTEAALVRRILLRLEPVTANDDQPVPWMSGSRHSTFLGIRLSRSCIHIRLMADGGLIGYQGTLRGPGGVRISRCRVETPRARANQDGMTLRYPYEVRKEDEYFGDIPDEQIPKDMLELASHIVETKSGHFEPEKFEDQYEDAPKGTAGEKQAGEKIEAPKERAKVINLMDALRRSVETERGGSANGKLHPPRRAAANPNVLCKTRVDCGVSAEFWPRRPFAVELQRRGCAARGWVLPRFARTLAIMRRIYRPRGSETAARSALAF
jgi:hypothetical protein